MSRRNSGHGLIMALDIGTSSSRAALFTLDGRRLLQTTAQQAYPLKYTLDGGAELSPKLLRSSVEDCIRRTLQVRRDDPRLSRQPIMAVGTSAFWHSMIGVGDKNKPVTPIYTWADSRCAGDAATLRGEFSEKRVHSRTGCMLRTSFWPARMEWLSRTRSDLRVRIWMSPAEWLYREFLGVANCSYSMASGTGLFRPDKLQWDEPWMERFGLDPNRVNIVGDEPIAGSSFFPELNSVPWYPAIGDGVASNLGSGATRPGFAAINVGTSAALRVMKSSGQARAPFGLFCYRVDSGRYVVGGAVSNAGNLRAWCMRELNLPADSKAIEREMSRRPTPAHGLTVLPYWTAERAPTWEEDQTGVIQGITQKTTAMDMLQAITEASYYRIAKIARLVLAKEKVPPKFIVSGGICRSASSLQRLADILNQPVYLGTEPEASIRGAAIFALEKMGVKFEAQASGVPVRPRKANAETYQKAQAALP